MVSKRFSLRKVAVALILISHGALLNVASVHAQEYPNRPIRMVVAWPAGGGTDSVARVVARHLGERLKQPVNVDNRSGASGIVGTEFVARAEPDGYTIQYTVADSHSINPHVFANVRFNALLDFTPVSMVGSMPNALIVHPSVPASTVSEFVALAKANPGRYTYGSWGIGSGGHIRMEAFNRHVGIDTLHVPYQGSGPALTGVVGGQVQAMMAPFGLAEAMWRAGRVKMLAVDTPARMPNADQVGTFNEQGVPLSFSFWQGLLVPAKTPLSVIERLNREMTAILKDPKAVAELAKVGVTVGTMGIMSVNEARGFFNSEFDRWGKVIREAKITAN